MKRATLGPDVYPACTADPVTFASTDYQEHLSARELCLGCEHGPACLQLGLGERFAQGTYGGVLLRDGRPVNPRELAGVEL